MGVIELDRHVGGELVKVCVVGQVTPDDIAQGAADERAKGAFTATVSAITKLVVKSRYPPWSRSR